MSTDQTLPALGFAAGLDEEDRRSFAQFGEFASYEGGEFLIREGEIHETLFLVLAGEFTVHTVVTGRPVHLGKLRAGDSVGEMNIFDPGRASATVESSFLSHVWRIERRSLEQFLESHPVAAGWFLVGIATQLSKRLRKANEIVAMSKEARFDSV